MAILVGLFTRLFGDGSPCRDHEFRTRYGGRCRDRSLQKILKTIRSQAAALASAVTNELFGALPANEAGRAGYDPEVL